MAKRKFSYSAYKLINRSELLSLLPPKYSMVNAEHITYRYPWIDEVLPEVEYAKIVEYCDDGEIEAYVVKMKFKEMHPTIYRRDGYKYHITWSLNPDRRKPFDSNKITSFATPIDIIAPLEVMPKFY